MAATGWSHRLRGLGKDTRGTSLIEFALAVPILLILYGASVEISDAIACNRKVAVTTRTVADLVAQNTTGTTSATEVDATLAASTQVMSPYSASKATIVITEVTTDYFLNTTVVWSRAINGTALRANSSVTIPAVMKIPGSYFLLSSVQYNYTPAFNFGLVGPKTFGGTLYMIPRNTNSISCADCNA